MTNDKLTREDEAYLIREAQAGRGGAMLELLNAYERLIRKVVREYTVLDRSAREDAKQEARLAFMELVHRFDPESGPLAWAAPNAIREALSAQLAGKVALTVPERTYRRYRSIMAKHDNNYAEALAAADSFGMTRETFGAVHEALHATAIEAAGEDEEGNVREVVATSLWSGDNSYADAEDRILCEIAFAAVDDLETDVCRMAYGFSEFDQVPDAEIAHRLGMTRPTVQRRRAGALKKMRDALGA